MSARSDCSLRSLPAALLAGCSAMRLAYDNADTYLRWRASSYLDLQGDEADELDERIDAFLAWHRAKALPQYARLAEEAAQRWATGSRARTSFGGTMPCGAGAGSLRAAAEQVAPLLDRLSAEQVGAPRAALRRGQPQVRDGRTCAAAKGAPQAARQADRRTGWRTGWGS